MVTLWPETLVLTLVQRKVTCNTGTVGGCEAMVVDTFAFPVDATVTMGTTVTAWTAVPALPAVFVAVRTAV